MKLSVQDSTINSLQVTLQKTQEEVCSLKATVSEQKDELHAGEMERRRLHNTIQELKVCYCDALLHCLVVYSLKSNTNNIIYYFSLPGEH